MTHADVRKIRRRVRAGEHQTDLAREYGVNRKTIRRRLDELEEVEAMAAEQRAASRLRRLAAREKQKLREREQPGAAVPAIEGTGSHAPLRSKRVRGVDQHYVEWLDQPKGMTWREASRARGDVRMKSADSTITKWVEREQVEALIDEGWLLAD